MLDKIFKSKDDFFRRPESVYIISRKSQKLFEKTIELMKCHVDLLNKNQTIEIGKFGDIHKCIDILINAVIENDLENDEISKNFIDQYSYFVFNWNENIYKDKNVTNKCRYLQRNIYSKMTLSDQIFTIKEINKKLSRECKIKPKAFEISEHYFNIIKDE